MTSPHIWVPPQSDPDIIAKHLIYLGKLGRSMPPSWDGERISHMVGGGDGALIGKILPGKGLYLDMDLNRVGITKPLPHVYQRSITQSLIDILKDERGAITTYDGIINARASAGLGEDWVTGKVSITTVANVWSSLYAVAGIPPTGTYCVDDKTEALTDSGWKYYNQITKEDQILAFDPIEKVTRWEPPTEIFVKENYVGDMYILGGKRLGAVTTPNHRWPIQQSIDHGNRGTLYDAPIRVFTSETLPDKGYILRRAPHKNSQTPIYTDAFVRLVAWYFTEGSLTIDGKGAIICQSDKVNHENVDQIRTDILDNGAVHNRPKQRRYKTRYDGLSCRETKRDDGIVRFRLRGTGVDELLKAVPGKEKIPTSEFIYSLTPEQNRIFVETCIRGDGHRDKPQFYQYHPKRMDAFMMAAVLAGFSPSLSKEGTTCSLRCRGEAGTWLHGMPKKIGQYNGVVWCPVTKSGHWVARRNGKVFITGNTNIPSGAAHSRASTGAWSLGLTNPTGGNKKYLLTMGFTSASQINLAILVDLLVCCGNISCNSGSSPYTINSTALTRYTSGAGVMMTFDITTALSATADNITISAYHNQAGTGSQTTAAIALTASAIVQRLQPAALGPFVQLASGDYGVQSVETITMSGANTGVLALNLYFPLMFIPNFAANTYVEKDSTVQIDSIQELVQTAGGVIGCLNVYILPNGTTSGVCTWFGRTCSG